STAAEQHADVGVGIEPGHLLADCPSYPLQLFEGGRRVVEERHHDEQAPARLAYPYPVQRLQLISLDVLPRGLLDRVRCRRELVRADEALEGRSQDRRRRLQEDE